MSGASGRPRASRWRASPSPTRGASGWQQQTLATPLAINAGTTYVVSVNANGYYAVTSNGFATTSVTAG